jgi:hypothetical protein
MKCGNHNLHWMSCREISLFFYKVSRIFAGIFTGKSYRSAAQRIRRRRGSGGVLACCELAGNLRGEMYIGDHDCGICRYFMDFLGEKFHDFATDFAFM